jgi:hypothetical protein
MTNTLQHTTFTTKKRKSISAEKMLHQEINGDMTKIKETIDELRILKCVSHGLKNYRKMLRVKKYD